MKIAVAMSGGIDSSVAAAILKGAGHEVFGITMLVMPPGSPEDDAVRRTGSIAERLGIRHCTVDLRSVFRKMVIDDFCREYALGRTPNPCIRCNRHIKFGVLLEKAAELGADRLATGHYARIETGETGEHPLLKKGADRTKDQSYVLYALSREQLARLILPIGGLTKAAVTDMARDMGLHEPGRRESQEICFIPDNDYAAFLENHLPALAPPGPLVDRQGNVIGRHRGIIHYTIGQRRGLGVATGEPQYVTAIDAAANTVFTGRKEDLYRREFLVSGQNWLTGDGPQQPKGLAVKIRYRHPEAAASIIPGADGSVRVVLQEPQPAITPGQSAVFYRDDTVIGGGIIEMVIK